MPQAANIVIADAATTPVNRTFKPLGKDANDVYWFEDQSASNAIGNWRISVKVDRPSAAQPGQNSIGRNYRTKIQLHEPVLETVSNSTVTGIAPAPTIAYTVRGLVEFVCPERSALQDRKNIRKMLPLLLQNTQIGSVVEDLEYLW